MQTAAAAPVHILQVNKEPMNFAVKLCQPFVKTRVYLTCCFSKQWDMSKHVMLQYSNRFCAQKIQHTQVQNEYVHQQISNLTQQSTTQVQNEHLHQQISNLTDYHTSTECYQVLT